VKTRTLFFKVEFWPRLGGNSSQEIFRHHREGTTKEKDSERTEHREQRDIVEDLLPRALVKRVRKIIPSDFQLTEIVIDAEVSGKVLGTGVSGTFSIKLSRSS
jgi:hypothetical protein